MQNNVLAVLFGNGKKSMKHTAIGIASPRYSKAGITRTCGGFDVAGFTITGNYRILSRKTGQIVDLNPRQLDQANLFAQIGVAYCLEHFSVTDPKTNERIFSTEALANKIRHECDEFGIAKPETVRGPGLYVDGSRLVVNYGNAVYDADGQPVDTTPTPSRTYVSGPSLGYGLETPSATAADVHLLETTFASFGFEKAWGAEASMGWFVSSAMGSVLPNSPSLIVTAEKGAGKSTWVALQSSLLGSQAVTRDGIPTVAQVLHTIKESSTALICDEFEPTKVSKSHMVKLAEVFNSGFTKSAGRGKFTRVIGGELKYFNPPAGVALCGINLPELEEALESRSVRLAMVPRNRAGQPKSPLLTSSGSELAQDLGARLRRLLVERWHVMRDTRQAVHQMLEDIGHPSRLADTYSPLLAGYAALKHATTPSREVLTELIARWELNEIKADEQESLSEACLNALLDRKVVLHVAQNGMRVRSHARIRDAIRMLVEMKSDQEARRPVETQLEMLGIRVLPQPLGVWRLAVASSQHHIGVRQLFQGTAWARGNWKDALLRLKGALKGQQRLAGDSMKVVVVNLPHSVCHPDHLDAVDEAATASLA